MFNLSFENFLFFVNTHFMESTIVSENVECRMKKTKSTLCQNKKIELKKVLFQRSCFHTTLKSSHWGDKLSCNIHLHVHLTRKITESSNQSGIVACTCSIMLHMGRWALRTTGLYNSYN
jgi:hypothetical protein